MAGASDIRAGRAFVELYTKDSQLVKGLRKARQNLKEFGDNLINVGRMWATASAGMLIPFGLSVKRFADFDDKMREVKAVAELTAAELTTLTAAAKKLGISTGFTATEVAGLMAELGRAGFSGKQIEQMTSSVLDLARASGTDATIASGIMAASIRQFGMDAGDATRVADALTKAANASFASVEGLGESLSYAGPVAADFGMSIEKTLAILGTLGNVGIQGSEAGTALRRLLTITGSEASKLKGIFGVAFTDAAGNARPLVDVLEEVNDSTKSLGSAERSKKFKDAFGLLGITAASALGKAAGSTKDLLKQLEGAAGTARNTAKEMNAGLGGSLRLLMSSAENVALAIGESLADSLQRATEFIGQIAAATVDWVKANGEIVKRTLLAVAAIGAAGGALIALGLAFKAAAFGLGAFTTLLSAVPVTLALIATAFAAITSPAAIVGVALAAAATGLWNFSNVGTNVVNHLLGAFAMLGNAVGKTFRGIRDAITSGNLELAGKIAMAGLKLAWAEGLDLLSRAWTAFETSLFKTFPALSIAVINVVSDIRKAWAEMIDGNQSAWQGLCNFMVQAFLVASNTLSNIGTDLGAELAKAWDWATTGIGDEQAQKERAERNKATDTMANAIKAKRNAAHLKAMAEAMKGSNPADAQKQLAEIEAQRQAALARVKAAGAPAPPGAPPMPANPELERQREELKRLLKELDEKKKAVEQEAGDKVAGMPAPGGGLGKGGGVGKVAGTFSAAAAIAQGAGCTDPIVDILRQQRIDHAKAEKQRQLDEKEKRRLAKEAAEFAIFMQ